MNELYEIYGGKVTKYPNDLYCDDKAGCYVNWDEARTSIGKTI